MRTHSTQRQLQLLQGVRDGPVRFESCHCHVFSEAFQLFVECQQPKNASKRFKTPSNWRHSAAANSISCVCSVVLPSLPLAKKSLEAFFCQKVKRGFNVSKRIQSNRRTWRDREWESFHSTASLPVPCKSWCLRMSPYHLSGYLLATLPFQSSKADGLLRPAFSWISYCMQIFLDIPLRTSLGLVPFCSSKIHRKFIAIVFVFFWLDVHVLPSGPVACRLDRYLGMSVMLSWSFVNFASSSLLVNC